MLLAINNFIISTNVSDGCNGNNNILYNTIICNKKYSYFTILNNNISICDMLYVSYLYTYIHETTMPNLVMA